MHSRNGRRFRFQAFERDPETRELFKHGHRLRVADKPFRIPMTLLERTGKVVSKNGPRGPAVAGGMADFHSLRSDPRFRALIGRIEQAGVASPAA